MKEPKLKHVQVFESFEDQEEQKPELGRGQKAAISRGDDILSDGQYAACYLNAIQAMGRAEDTRGRGDTGLTRNALKMVGKEQEDWQKISGAKLSIYLNLKPQTVERTVSKFKLLLQGERSGTESNVIWPELVASFDKFEAMPKGEVLAMAEEAIDSDGDDTAYREYLDKSNAASKETLAKKKEQVGKRVDNFKRLFTSLKNTFDPDKAARMAVTKFATENEMTTDEVMKMAFEIYKKDPVTMKYFKKKIT
jgi:hypothetical protein